MGRLSPLVNAMHKAPEITAPAQTISAAAEVHNMKPRSRLPLSRASQPAYLANRLGFYGVRSILLARCRFPPSDDAC